MDLGFPTRRVREGRVELLVPDIPQGPGPGTRSALPFYNPSMAIARDIAVLVAARLLRPGGTLLDGLAGTGALGLRIAAESGRDPAVTLNDKNPRAVALIRANLELNPSLRADVAGEDLNARLATRHYDVVEVDPFGSPVPFIDAALRSAHRGSVLGVTATDTAVLCGAKPEAARRRYLAQVRRTDAYAEVGARVLLGYIARMAGRLDKAAEPVLAYAAEHFVKAYVRISEGASRADRVLSDLGWVRPDPETGAHDLGSGSVPGDGIGPLWMGPLSDPTVLEGLVARPWMGHRTAVLCERIRGEAGLPPFFFEHNAMARRAGVSPPPLAEVLEGLRGQGHRAVLTHFRGNSLRTDATPSDLLRTYRGLRKG